MGVFKNLKKEEEEREKKKERKGISVKKKVK